jgi:TusE/DsrC/DsvC family sulfur relay protein
MYDINKFIANPRLRTNDPDGNLIGLDHWSPLVANRLAEEDGMTLTDEHWQVIYCLRERFRLLGPDWTARGITHELALEYTDVGGRRYLYGLFPRGPIAQACRLAGLPLPHGTLNVSFGSVH